MTIALLLGAAATVATGLMLHAEEEGRGPLAPFYAGTAAVDGVPAIDGEGADGNEDEDGKDKDGKDEVRARGRARRNP